LHLRHCATSKVGQSSIASDPRGVFQIVHSGGRTSGCVRLAKIGRELIAGDRFQTIRLSAGPSVAGKLRPQIPAVEG
jgi:hypothetical protein